MNANKQPLWKQAWQMLIQKQYIQVTAAPNRQQLISVLRIPDYLRPREVADKAPSAASADGLVQRTPARVPTP
jgi:hypothetical protein